jgi:hypothetical protein
MQKKTNKTLIVSALGFLSLSACTPNTAANVIATAPIESIKPIVPSIDELDLESVTWVVITESNYESVIAQLKKDRKDTVLYALSYDSYISYVNNNIDIQKLIRQQQQIIAVYKNW